MGAGSFVRASTQSISAGTSSTLNPSSITVSAWVKATSFPADYNTIISREEATPPYGYTFLIKSNGKLAIYVRDSSSGDIHYDGTGINTLSAGTWYYVTFSYSANGSLIGYVNGSLDGSTVATANGLASNSTPFNIGSSLIAPRNWNGSLDDIRISSTARSANWITTEYNNQSSNATWWSAVGSEESGTSIKDIIGGFGIIAFAR